METRKPAPLRALTGLRCFAAINIVLFHFSNPQWFNFNFYFPAPFMERSLHIPLLLAPVVNAGFISVSYFILLSGFVLGYNYNERARNGELDRKRFWEARFTRIYPIYFLSLLLSLGTLGAEYRTHTHAMFWTGVVLTPLLLQGWIPAVATFLNTPAWTMSAEAFYYVIFPWLARSKKPVRLGPYIAKLAGVWLLGLTPGALYIAFNPDGIVHPNRWSYGPWLWALKYTPYAHIFSFIFGVMLANLDAMIPRASHVRLWLGLIGFGGIYGILSLGPLVPYAIIHDGLLMPLFAFIVLGLAGENPLARALGVRPLVFVGEASYCLYLLHFNLWNMIHDSHVLVVLGLSRFDPWLSYVLLIALSLVALYFIEKPAQRKLREWMHATNVIKEPVVRES
ncbi:MAG TPA: acyltransferase [Terracidiphilus sp.]|nr:acyltransferase [Terracidiphilus sp.]